MQLSRYGPLFQRNSLLPPSGPWTCAHQSTAKHRYALSRNIKSHPRILTWSIPQKEPPISLRYVKVKWSRYRLGVAQRMGRGIALLFHDRGTRRGWVVSSTPRPHFNPGIDPVPILQEAGWAPGPVWSGGKSRPHRDSIPTVQPVAQSLYRLSYPAHHCVTY